MAQRFNANENLFNRFAREAADHLQRRPQDEGLVGTAPYHAQANLEGASMRSSDRFAAMTQQAMDLLLGGSMPQLRDILARDGALSPEAQRDLGRQQRQLTGGVRRAGYERRRANRTPGGLLEGLTDSLASGMAGERGRLNTQLAVDAQQRRRQNLAEIFGNTLLPQTVTSALLPSTIFNDLNQEKPSTADKFLEGVSGFLGG